MYLSDIWPSGQEVAQTVGQVVRADMFRRSYDDVFAGDERWNGLEVPAGERFAWDESSTYVHQPPYFQDMPREAPPVRDISDARVLALLGDSVTTDHISPAGAIKRDGPAGIYLQSLGVAPKEFNSYGSRRGNHEVMMRGTFANIRLRNLIAGQELVGGLTLKFPDKDELPISFLLAKGAGKLERRGGQRKAQRKSMSPAARKAVSVRMRKYWAARRKASK